MRKVFAAVLAFGMSVSAFAVEDIKGAFGFEFGEIVDTSKLKIAQPNVGDPRTYYKVTPRIPVQFFSKYTISATPESKQLMAVIAEGDGQPVATCIEQQKAILQLLFTKYISENRKLEPEDLEIPMVAKDGKKIIINCVGTPQSARLKVRYFDDALSELAMKEKKEAMFKNLDTTHGL